MKKPVLLTLAIFLFAGPLAAQYEDHRGRQVDSLENVVAGWTPERLVAASYEDKTRIADAFMGLAWGYLNTSRERSEYFARRLMSVSESQNWLFAYFDGAKIVGMHFYAEDQFDSARVYYALALDAIYRMQAGETNLEHPDGYEASTIDDALSSLYGQIGNMYNMMDSIPQAMEYYRKAAEIFERYGWNESSSVLWHNIGETWLDEGDLRQAQACYDKALEYGRAAGDSLMIADALKGLAQVDLRRGRTSSALRHLRDADNYYSQHWKDAPSGRLELLDAVDQVLSRQKRQWSLIAVASAILLLLVLTVQFLLRRMRALRHAQDAADAVIDEAMAALPPSVADDDPDDAPSGRPVIIIDGDEKPFLSDREAEILPLLASGLTSPQIAERLYLSLPTIKWYRRKLLEKFDATNTADLIARAKERGLV